MPIESQEEVRLIRDKAGQEYTVTLVVNAPYWRLRVYDRLAVVGQANSREQRPVLMVDDLEIKAQVAHPCLDTRSFLVRKFGPRMKPVDYRRKGVGSALLRLIIDRARQQGFATIQGGIAQRDLDEFPGLPDWYKRHGLTVTPGGRHGCGHIELVLSP